MKRRMDLTKLEHILIWDSQKIWLDFGDIDPYFQGHQGQITVLNKKLDLDRIDSVHVTSLRGL